MKNSNPLRIVSKGAALTGVCALMLTLPNMAYAQTITFQQIMRAPDDVSLNLAFARQQVAAGNLLVAASAVERVLLMNPNADDARLFYADLLIQMDDTQAANRELEILADRDLSPAQLRKYNSLGGSRSEDTSNSGGVSGYLAAGVRYDDNAGEVLSDSLVAVANADDFAVVLQGGVNYFMPMSESGVSLRAGLNGQTVRHETFSRIDYDTLRANVGLAGSAGTLDWRFDGSWSNVFIDNDKYLGQIGIDGTLMTEVAESTHIYVKGGYYDQDFSDFGTSAGEDDRSGDYMVGKAGVVFKVSPQTEINVSGGYENKKAKIDAFAYDGWRLDGSVKSEFESGKYTNLQAYYRDLKYDDMVTPRDDKHLYGRAAVGAPLSEIFKSSSAPENLTIEGAVSYLDRNSSVAGLDYNSFGVEARFILGF